MTLVGCELLQNHNTEKFHLVACYEPNPSRWLKMRWVNQYTGDEYRITTEDFHGTRDTARVKTYGDVMREYEFHPGSKSADVHRKTSGKQTVGLLRRRHIRVGQIIYIGKESNKLEEMEAGTIHSAQRLHRISRSAPRGMADEGIASAEKNSRCAF